jgi:anti-sigma regulatory factor (Ser/Thr protein kinase)
MGGCLPFGGGARWVDALWVLSIFARDPRDTSSPTRVWSVTSGLLVQHVPAHQVVYHPSGWGTRAATGLSTTESAGIRVPLNEPALALGPDPRSVQAARRWVTSAFRRLDRAELLECAELGVSELVTNALLHAESPISLRVRGTTEHPRIEVSDASTQAPILSPLNGPGDDLDAVLATVGRGLSIVSMCSVAWGVAIEADGKSVWFEPAKAPRQDAGPGAPLYHAEPDEPIVEEPDPTAISVVLPNLPVPKLTEFGRHYQELRRELRLLAMSHQNDYPLAQDLTKVFRRFDDSFPESIRRQYVEAIERGDSTIDLELHLHPSATTVIEQMLELLDLADEFCRAKRLLSLARTPEQREFQQWYFGELIRQARGEPPSVWPPSEHAQHVS